MRFNGESLPSAAVILSTAASITASLMMMKTIVNDLIPEDMYDYVAVKFRGLFLRLSNHFSIVIKEFDGLNANQMFEATDKYLSLINSSSVRRLCVHKEEQEKLMAISIDKGEEVVDTFNGAQFTWILISEKNKALDPNHGTGAIRNFDSRHFELSFHKKHKELALNSYLPYVLERAQETKQKGRAPKIYSIDNLYGELSDVWGSIYLDHPATFETLAMDEVMKKEIMDDLKIFVQRKDFYRRVGKAWKRGYLLYGPPGTGKSSLIAAMANFLNFDVYDLQLTEVESNNDLRRVLLATGNRSILVVEDIDCSGLKDRSSSTDDGRKKTRITLSGVLNIVDGLWSSVGNERIIVFTTNHKDRLDPALLRPGRMDMHVHMNYCSFSAFKVLVFNYLQIDYHPLFERIRTLIDEVEITPAEVAEVLMRNKETTCAIEDAIQAMEKKKELQEKQEDNGEEDVEGREEDDNGEEEFEEHGEENFEEV
ncbi:AAA-ATPase At3g50940-like [Nymphaea colorata]|nr:AAA-ATPase At3g50940-like [Nymphaea colorata]